LYLYFFQIKGEILKSEMLKMEFSKYKYKLMLKDTEARKIDHSFTAQIFIE
jgi:hypothetical protein